MSFPSYILRAGYLLSKKEQRLGSPEKPLSALGAIGYRKYWTYAVMRFLYTAPDHIKLEGELELECYCSWLTVLQTLRKLLQ